MIPDYATILRRRHVATVAARSLVVLYGGWCAYHFVVGPVSSVCGLLLNWSNNSGVMGTILLGNLASDLYAILPGSLIVLYIVLEKRLVRWIVPMPVADHACPSCGYSLKNLNSPICPECGVSLPK